MGTHISPRREISPQQDLFPHLSWFSGAVGLYQIESSRVPSSARVSMQPGHGVCTPPLGLCCVGGQECCPCSIQGAADFSLQLPYCNLFTLTHLPIILHHTTSHLWRQKRPQTKQIRKTQQEKVTLHKRVAWGSWFQMKFNTRSARGEASTASLHFNNLGTKGWTLKAMPWDHNHNLLQKCPEISAIYGLWATSG